ncbi:Tyrosine-protein kinase BAZ1B [Folsomia candida]|uniref:Tyrosine-protein kinase BAZ1B n=1 Tax=Folsomia candida TaxID=158441 RepID=A0A226DM16_FOLCA|nr:Tyrosine-protein kinase BAZ1B [Folsomia candida]
MSNCSNSNTSKCCEPPKKACPPPAPPPCTNFPATLTFACLAEECKPVPKPPCPEKPKDDCTCVGAASAYEEPKPKNNNSDDQRCPISTCPGASNTDDDNWILCDHCQTWYHTACVAVVVIPENEWLCPDCFSSQAISSSQNSTTTRKKHTIASTQHWLKLNIMEDPSGQIPKSEVVTRYAHHIETSGEGKVHDVTVAKYINQLFPNATLLRPRARALQQSIDEQQFNFAKLNHAENCPYRPAGGAGVLPGSRDEEEDEIDWQPEVGVESDEDTQTIFD